MAACTPDGDLARQIQQHAIDEARHSRAYVRLIDLVFGVDQGLRRQLDALSPGYTKATRLAPAPGSPYAQPATVDELVQMNIAEIRTRIQHLLQRPVLLSYCEASVRARVQRILDSLLFDETRHIAYTARLIERAAQAAGAKRVIALMGERVKDFNEITDGEVARTRLFAA